MTDLAKVEELKDRLPYFVSSDRRIYTEELTIDDIVEIYNKQIGLYSLADAIETLGEGAINGIKKFLDGRKITSEFGDTIKEVLNNDDLWFSDFQFYGDVFKRIEYEPFTTIFETSGKIIVENDLREYFEGSDNFNTNSTRGIIQTMEFYAKQGMLHGFVGNSCPSLILSEEHGQINIGVEWEEDEPAYPDDTYKGLTSVCTDLWWYSIVDAETFQKNNPDVDISNFEVVEIPAGKWELSHKYGISERGYHENLPYATMKYIGL